MSAHIYIWHSHKGHIYLWGKNEPKTSSVTGRLPPSTSLNQEERGQQAFQQGWEGKKTGTELNARVSGPLSGRDRNGLRTAGISKVVIAVGWAFVMKSEECALGDGNLSGCKV